MDSSPAPITLPEQEGEITLSAAILADRLAVTVADRGNRHPPRHPGRGPGFGPEVTFIDSTGIKLLLQATERDADAGRLRMIRGSDDVQRVLRLAEAESQLPFDDE
jgi:hypothetical protein